MNTPIFFHHPERLHLYRNARIEIHAFIASLLENNISQNFENRPILTAKK